MLSQILWAAAAGFAGSVELIAAVREWAHRRALLDHPNERSLHSRPTPRGGGLGIVVAVLVCLLVLAVTDSTVRAPVGWIAGVGAVLAAVGLTDDIRGLPAVARLLLQTAGAVALTAALGHWRVFAWPGPGEVTLGWFGLPLTLVLVVGLTNAYNFMDGIDGIAGAQGVAAGLGWAGAGVAIQEPSVATTGAVLAASSLGFLVFNWPPASIFMGDVGSSFLGFVLAALVVMAAPRSPDAALAGVLFVWPFVFDTTFTFLRRMRRGEHLLSAHRTHLYQRLILTGVTHRAVTVTYGALALVGVTTGLAVVHAAKGASIAGAISICVLAAGLWIAVVWRERAARARTDRDTQRFGEPGPKMS